MLFLLALSCAPRTAAPVDPAPEPAAQEAPAAPAAPSAAPAEAGCAAARAETWEGDTTLSTPWGAGRPVEVELDGDAAPEVVFEVADSCGSGGCELAVLDPCAAPDQYRLLGILEIDDGYTVGTGRANGLLDLLATHGRLDPETATVETSTVTWWFDGERYQRAQGIVALQDDQGRPLARAFPVSRPDSEAACPTFRIEHHLDGRWVTRHTGPAMPRFSRGPQGQIGAMLTCAEHLEAAYIDGQVVPVSVPEYAEAVEWEEGPAGPVLQIRAAGAPPTRLVRGPQGWRVESAGGERPGE